MFACKQRFDRSRIRPLGPACRIEGVGPAPFEPGGQRAADAERAFSPIGAERGVETDAVGKKHSRRTGKRRFSRLALAFTSRIVVGGFGIANRAPGDLVAQGRQVA